MSETKLRDVLAMMEKWTDLPPPSSSAGAHHAAQMRRALIESCGRIGVALANAQPPQAKQPVPVSTVHVQGGSDPLWPPPFAADKGFAQFTGMEGFALTYSGGAAFVHMKPLTVFGANAEARVLDQLAARLAAALASVRNRAGALQSAQAAAVAQAEADEAEAAGEEGEEQAPVTEGEPETEADEEQCPHTNKNGRCILDAGHEPESCIFPQVGS